MYNRIPLSLPGARLSGLRRAPLQCLFNDGIVGSAVFSSKRNFLLRGGVFSTRGKSHPSVYGIRRPAIVHDPPRGEI